MSMVGLAGHRILPGILAATVAAAGLAVPQGSAQAPDIAGVEQKLNEPIFAVTAQNRSYKTLFDAFLDVEVPNEVTAATENLRLASIYPGMDNWSVVSGWAETYPNLRQAILDSRDRILIGLPYGRDALARDLGDASKLQDYLTHGMYADIAVEGNLRDQDFAYMRVLDAIAAFSAAECYRLLEAGDAQMAVDLATAQIYINDQFCERWFLEEKMHAMQLQIDFLASLRDMMYLFEEQFTIDQLAARDYSDDRKGFAFELPYLRLDLLEMPTADAEVAEELLKTVFTGDEADPAKFVEVFAEMQSEGAPLTQFGAAKRWRMVSSFHASRLASLERLQLVFDDWWRRWGVRAWHPILNLDTQYERTNPVRFAAVTFALKDMSEIFDKRRELIAAVNGTAISAGLIAYKKRFGTYPDDLEKIYATFVRKRTNMDPFDREARGFLYRYEPSPVFIDAGALGFVSVQGGILWARGQDFESDRASRHSPDGALPGSDIVYWPPLRTVAREGG